MKKLYSIFLISLFVVSAVAGPEKKKQKIIDHYFLDNLGNILEKGAEEFAVYEVNVLQDADSIKVHTANLYTEFPVSMETYKVLNDSIQQKWGTQVMFDALGNLRRIQYIDLTRGTDDIVQYDDSNRVEQRIFKDAINGRSQSTSYYKNGQKKGVSESVQTLDGKFINTVTSWFQNGRLMREQRIENGQTVAMRIYDDTGAISFTLPCQHGDSIFYNKEGNITSRKNAVSHGVISLVEDSILITKFDDRGRKISVENYMSYNPENPVAWGTQKYFYANTAQPSDSVLIFRSINGDNLVENTYYEDGKLKSSSTLIFNNVMVADRMFRQYYPSGVLRRVEKHHGAKLVEGHIYDSEGKETLPFYEFKP